MKIKNQSSSAAPPSATGPELAQRPVTARSTANLRSEFDRIRKQSVTLTESLSEEDCCAQSMPDASPLKWHLAHTTWFFETFILEPAEPGFRPHHPAFRMLFNSYYNGIGEKHVRAQRGLLTRPSFDEVLAYRHDIDTRIGRLLQDQAIASSIAALVELGLHHEQQHQELMLTDIKHLLSINPMKPAYCRMPELPPVAPLALDWVDFAAAVVGIGAEEEGFRFDNETPRHRQFVEPYALASRLVTNGEYLDFVQAGGYREASWWLSEGWDWVCANQLECPLYWRKREDRWEEFTLYGMQAIDAQRPALHLSYFEAEAYARWAGSRLPTEVEWEHAATSAAGEPSQLSQVSQLYGVGWQWTTSSYAPYPGYQTEAGAIGEYNGKFMVNQYVLRGSSCATPAGHTRATYRNFFPASARWQFTGIRLARSS